MDLLAANKTSENELKTSNLITEHEKSFNKCIEKLETINPKIQDPINNTSFEIEELSEKMINYRDFCGSQEWTVLQKKPASLSLYSLGSQGNIVKSSTSFKFPNQNEIKNTFFFSDDTSKNCSINDSPNYSLRNSETITTSEDNNLINYFNSSLISDYRLTITDLIELNLIDISTGLIINPLTGARLTIADAIRIDLLNSDIKEIANTFQSPTNPANKLTVKEAIQLSVLNPFRNEIYLSPLNQTLRLNLYDARKRNLILKPLTLSEAFIRNLIQPNGFVRNPINGKYYAFETLIEPDLKRSQLDHSPMYLFDLDTKHIIDPNDKDKRLLSLSEAIDLGLIIPRTFELCINTSKHKTQKLNLYEAFFHTRHLSLSLLLYRPEIENVFIKLTSSLSTKSVNNQKFSRVSLLLSKRERIGLVEAMCLNAVDLKNLTYSTVPNENEIPETIDLKQASFVYNLIDSEMLNLLNTPIGIRRNKTDLTILDCLIDNSLILEKYLFRNPFSNQLVQIDSQSCKTLLSDDVIRRVKRLITRVNVKSYVISLNNEPMNENYANLTHLINIKSPTVVYNQLHKVNQTKEIREQRVSDTVLKTPQLQSEIPEASFYYTLESKSNNQINEKQPVKTSMNSMKTLNIDSSNMPSLWRFDESNKTTKFSTTINDENENETSSLVKETKAYVLEFAMDNGLKITIQEAKRRGILNVEKGVYIDSLTNKSIPIDEAVQTGLIGARLTVSAKNFISDKEVQNKGPNEIELKRNHESFTLTIKSVIDARSGVVYSISEAIKIGILDETNLSYKNSLNGQLMSLNEAYLQSYVRGNFYENQANELKKNLENSELVMSKGLNGNIVLNEREEKCLRIESILNTKTKTRVNLDQAINDGIFDKANGLYIESLTGAKLNLNEAVKKGYISVEESEVKNIVKNTKDTPVLKIDVKNINVKTNNKHLTDTLLYEVNEVENVVLYNMSNGVVPSLQNGKKLNERIEHVIEDEDYDDIPNQLPTSEVKRRRKNESNIIERRIPSLYGGESLNTSETLIIDDVRRSAMLDIDGITHVLKNEVLIDSDFSSNPSSQRLTSVSEIESLEPFQNSNQISTTGHYTSSSSSSLSSDNSTKKSNNRCVIIVDDQLINHAYSFELPVSDFFAVNSMDKLRDSNFNKNNSLTSSFSKRNVSFN